MPFNFILASISWHTILFLCQSRDNGPGTVKIYSCINLKAYILILCIIFIPYNFILASISCHTILFFYQSHVIHFYSSINPMSYIFILASISCHTILFFYQSHVIHFYSCIILMLNNFILLCRLY